ncbi:MAG: hypothetical protein HZC36_04775 [Armatimonadetes bacterium]|nr:hypothetical protein [Armatimonadota bacterium]
MIAPVPPGTEANRERGSTFRVHIPWRRRDKHPEAIDVVVTDAKGNRIPNVLRREINREFGDLIFEPVSGPGTYYFYHLPHVTQGTYYPKVDYTPPSDTADPTWKLAASEVKWGDLPEAKAVRFESVSAFDAFTPMELIATQAETEDLLNLHPAASYLVFPEDRHLSVRMWDDIPYRWAQRGANTPFTGHAKRGEYFTFQLGVWACRGPLERVKVRFSNLKIAAGRTLRSDKASPKPVGRTLQSDIPKSAISCFNTGGIDYKGKSYTTDLSVPKGRVQPLWCGIDVPVDVKPGTYVGTAAITATGAKETRIPITLVVGNDVAKDHGDDRPEDMTRLRWLNSKLGLDKSVVMPFEADGPLACYTVPDKTGFFQQVGRPIHSRMDRFSLPNVWLFADQMALRVEGASGVYEERVVPLLADPKKRLSSEAWDQESRIGPIVKRLKSNLDFDGTLDYQIALTAEKAADLKDIRLELPINKEVAQYFMGLGRDGGRAPRTLDWKWDIRNAQEGAWVGSVNCGLMFALRDEHYVRPLNTNFYHEKPLVMPTSWCNGGKGGIRIRTEKDAYRITCYSGPRKMKKGETLHFNVHMLLTPFKLIDPRRQFSERYYHSFKPLDEIQKDGANVVNVHHATAINPWINYPFLVPDKLRAYIADAHKRGMKVKIYDTIRELTNRTPELFMLKSLGHEVFSPGKGGGGSWLREHLDDDYIPAWHAVEVGDAAIINSGMSRWHNYYIEGLDWLARNVGIDGLYLDDVAFDRTTMLRVRRVLERRIAERTNPARGPSVPSSLGPSSAFPTIDLHSANQHNERDGWNNSALLYMDLMPFLDRLWFGEYFDYNKDVLATVYLRGGPATPGNEPPPMPKNGPSGLIAIASWAKEDIDVRLKIDWKALGMDPKKVKLSAKPIVDFQPAAKFQFGEAIRVPTGKGWLLTLEPK